MESIEIISYSVDCIEKIKFHHVVMNSILASGTSEKNPWRKTCLSPQKTPCLECLLGLKLTLNLKWHLYIQSTIKDTEKMVGFSYHSSKYPTPHCHTPPPQEPDKTKGMAAIYELKLSSLHLPR